MRLQKVIKGKRPLAKVKKAIRADIKTLTSNIICSEDLLEIMIMRSVLTI